jgi:FixJ family two-component response regulator
MNVRLHFSSFCIHPEIEGSSACLALDLELPDIHGLELQKELADRDAPPIVFITGTAIFLRRSKR